MRRVEECPSPILEREQIIQQDARLNERTDLSPQLRPCGFGAFSTAIWSSVPEDSKATARAV